MLNAPAALGLRFPLNWILDGSQSCYVRDNGKKYYCTHANNLAATVAFGVARHCMPQENKNWTPKWPVKLRPAMKLLGKMFNWKHLRSRCWNFRDPRQRVSWAAENHRKLKNDLKGRSPAHSVKCCCSAPLSEVSPHEAGCLPGAAPCSMAEAYLSLATVAVSIIFVAYTGCLLNTTGMRTT